MIIDENLPYKYVHPGINYFAFSEDKGSQPYLCSCQKQSLINRIELFMRYYQYDLCLNDRGWLLLEKHLQLPSVLDRVIKDSNIPYGSDWVNLLSFKDNLCHLCNQVTPTTNHTDYIYTTKLEQKYGHYINTSFYTKGIGNHLPDFYGVYFLEDTMSEDLLSVLKPTKEEILRDIVLFNAPTPKETQGISEDLDFIFNLPDEVRDIILYRREQSKYLRDKGVTTSYDLIKTYPIGDSIELIQNVLWKRYLTVKKIIVDEVKQSFKLRRWMNESLLGNLITEMFKGITVYRNYRPQILGGLELDIYLPDFNLGIEYQGVQHEKTVDLWGGEEGFLKRQENDKRKAALCKQHKIDLVYFWHYENITKELIEKKLGKYLTFQS